LLSYDHLVLGQEHCYFFHLAFLVHEILRLRWPEPWIRSIGKIPPRHTSPFIRSVRSMLKLWKHRSFADFLPLSVLLVLAAKAPAIEAVIDYYGINKSQVLKHPQHDDIIMSWKGWMSNSGNGSGTWRYPWQNSQQSGYGNKGYGKPAGKPYGKSGGGSTLSAEDANEMRQMLQENRAERTRQAEQRQRAELREEIRGAVRDEIRQAPAGHTLPGPNAYDLPPPTTASSSTAPAGADQHAEPGWDLVNRWVSATSSLLGVTNRSRSPPAVNDRRGSPPAMSAGSSPPSHVPSVGSPISPSTPIYTAAQVAQLLSEQAARSSPGREK